MYENGLPKRPANFAQLTPLGFLDRAATGFADQVAVIAGERRITYGEFNARCHRLASALAKRGVARGDTVSIVAANIPAMLEAHFGVPMLGAVLNGINTRLDAPTVRFILQHGEAKVFLVDAEFASLAQAALEGMAIPPLVVRIDDPEIATGSLADAIEYETLLAEGDSAFTAPGPADEWDAIALNYTSGTVGDPKGVVIHHRGAFVNALSAIITFKLAAGAVYLWTLPMFHCNGWCQTWAITALAGTHVCLRKVDPERIFDLIDRHRVTHASGAPIVLNLLLRAAERAPRRTSHMVAFTVGGAAPVAAVLERMRELDFDITHGYGLTETYGPSVVCEWKDGWDERDIAEQAELISRQGLPNYGISELMVADPETLEPVPADRSTIGEVLLRGATVMKGYLKNPRTTDAAFAGDWFHTGDLAVRHPDGYIEIKDRAKDIIISGGENISSIEVEAVLYRHPAVGEAAVVAMADPHWGETPCAFITLKDGAEASGADLVRFCRERMAHFKVPKRIIFGPLPKTATGKIQKFVLREAARTAGGQTTSAAR